jgi:hypothetical protein
MVLKCSLTTLGQNLNLAVLYHDPIGDPFDEEHLKIHSIHFRLIIKIINRCVWHYLNSYNWQGIFRRLCRQAKEALLSKLATNIKNNMFSTKSGYLFEIVNATL